MNTLKKAFIHSGHFNTQKPKLEKIHKRDMDFSNVGYHNKASKTF